MQYITGYAIIQQKSSKEWPIESSTYITVHKTMELPPDPDRDLPRRHPRSRAVALEWSP